MSGGTLCGKLGGYGRRRRRRPNSHSNKKYDAYEYWLQVTIGHGGEGIHRICTQSNPVTSSLILFGHPLAHAYHSPPWKACDPFWNPSPISCAREGMEKERERVPAHSDRSSNSLNPLSLYLPRNKNQILKGKGLFLFSFQTGKLCCRGT